MPYYDTDGNKIATRYRLTLGGGKSRFQWARGTKICPYGLWKLEEAHKQGYVVLVEGESDAQTLWYHHIPGLGVPGATAWKAEWAKYVEDLTVYIWQEPDNGGSEFVKRVGKSVLSLKVIQAPARCKDVSECHLAGDKVPELMKELIAQAIPYQQIQAEMQSKEAKEAREQCERLLESDNILEELEQLCQKLGMAGQRREAKLLYLALSSRLLDKPVSVAVKGPSSGGKSFLVETVLKAFPTDAYLDFTSISEKALIYDERPIAHRFIVVYEYSGLANDTTSYIVRSLLSENCIKYSTVEKTPEGLRPRTIEREGPTGLIVTTTRTTVHPENETRVLSITVNDDPIQTRAILKTLGEEAKGVVLEPPGLKEWHALQRWLELAGCREVVIPFADSLAELCDPKAVRLRRDFSKVLSLVKAHALLHQKKRERDAQGRILATLEDYRVVYSLVADIVSEGVESMVKDTVRQTVELVKEACIDPEDTVTVTELSKRLGIDRSAMRRRVKEAIEKGYLINLNPGKGKTAKLRPGEPMPEDKAIIPDPEVLGDHYSQDICVCVNPPKKACTGAQVGQPPGDTQGEISERSEHSEAKKLFLSSYVTTPGVPPTTPCPECEMDTWIIEPGNTRWHCPVCEPPQGDEWIEYEVPSHQFRWKSAAGGFEVLEQEEVAKFLACENEPPPCERRRGDIPTGETPTKEEGLFPLYEEVA